LDSSPVFRLFGGNYGGAPLVERFLKAFDFSQVKQLETEGLPGAARMIGMVESGASFLPLSILPIWLPFPLFSSRNQWLASDSSKTVDLSSIMIGTLLSLFAIIIAIVVQAIFIFLQLPYFLEMNLNCLPPPVLSLHTTNLHVLSSFECSNVSELKRSEL